MAVAVFAFFLAAAAVALCGANHAGQGFQANQALRRPFPPEHRPSRNPMEALLRRKTRDSLQLDILVTAGLDPCLVNSSEIKLTANAGFEKQVIGHVSDSLLFGLRGFDEFRQKIVRNHVGTRLAFRVLEGTSKVTLIGKPSMQLNFVMTGVIIDVYSKLQMKDQTASLAESKFIRFFNPKILIQPLGPIVPQFLQAIGHSLIKSAQKCVQKHFIPAFQSGVNNALSSKNLTQTIEDMQKEPSLLHSTYSETISKASSKVLKALQDATLPDISLTSKVGQVHNFTNGHILKMSEPKLYFINKALKKNTYNLQIIIPDVLVVYKWKQQPLFSTFSNVQYYLQIHDKGHNKLKITKGALFHLDFIPKPVPLPYPDMKPFHVKLTSNFVLFLQKHLEIAFSKAI